MNTYWTEVDYLSFLIFRKIFFKCIKNDHQAFEEHLFVHLSIIIVLHCITSFDNETKHLNIILKQIVGKYRAATDIYIILCKSLLYCYKHFIDLHYKQSEFIILCPDKYQHQIAYFCLFWASEYS